LRAEQIIARKITIWLSVIFEMRAGRFLPIDAETVKSHRLCAQHFIEPPVAV